MQSIFIQSHDPALAATAMTYYLATTVSDRSRPKLIGFIGSDGTSSFDLLGSLEAFAVAR